MLLPDRRAGATARSHEKDARHRRGHVQPMVVPRRSKKTGPETPRPVLTCGNGAAFGIRTRDLRITRSCLSVNGSLCGLVGAPQRRRRRIPLTEVDRGSLHDSFHAVLRRGAGGAPPVQSRGGRLKARLTDSRIYKWCR